MLFPGSFIRRKKSRNGILFHKSPEWLLLKEKKSSHLLHDDCSASCSPRGGRFGQAYDSKEVADNSRIARDGKRFLGGAPNQMEFHLVGNSGQGWVSS